MPEYKIIEKQNSPWLAIQNVLTSYNKASGHGPADIEPIEPQPAEPEPIRKRRPQPGYGGH